MRRWILQPNSTLSHIKDRKILSQAAVVRSTTSCLSRSASHVECRRYYFLLNVVQKMFILWTFFHDPCTWFTVSHIFLLLQKDIIDECCIVYVCVQDLFSRRYRFIAYTANRKQNSLRWAMIKPRFWQRSGDACLSLDHCWAALLFLMSCSSDSMALPSDPLTPECACAL